jgi:transcription elongation GreA/GreB family factor
MSGAYYGLSYEEKKVSDAKPQEGTISDQSPIGKAVIGHIKGDEFSVFLPEGVVVKYRLIDVN